MLAACNPSPGNVARVPLPPLDTRIAAPCEMPTAAVGDNAKSYAARVTGALAICKSKHQNVVTTYNELRNGLAGK